MKYLFLICAETLLEDMPAQEAKSHLAAMIAYTERLRDSGHFLSANRLQPPATATTVRVREGKPLVTDGPFAETTELLGGYYLIEARDLDEAIEIAAGFPTAKFGSVEIRPIANDAQMKAFRFDEGA